MSHFKVFTRRVRNGYRAFVTYKGETLAWTRSARPSREIAWKDGWLLADIL